MRVCGLGLGLRICGLGLRVCGSGLGLRVCTLQIIFTEEVAVER